MSYTITTSSDHRHVILKVTGYFGRQQALKYHLEAHQVGAEQGIERFLLDLTEGRNTDTVLRNYTFVSQDMKTPGINLNARIAILVNPHDHSHDYLESFMRTAGIDAALFYEYDLAVAFLNMEK